LYRDEAFINIIKTVRGGILRAGNLDSKHYHSILMQGSGSFGVEAVLASVVDKSKGVLDMYTYV
jgi:2-aminoethylphosphonate-pyruvate transaminase